MSNPGAVAAGHNKTAEAAAIILENGGNAFDAIIAAQFAACVAEPVLSSLGGGAALIAKPQNSNPRVYDFFVSTPQQRFADQEQFFPITADFGTTEQEFHIGLGAAATPGLVKGLFAIHRDLATMPMGELLQPAITLARQGVTVNAMQAYIFSIVAPIYLQDSSSREIFCKSQNDNQLLENGDKLFQSDLANTLERLAVEGEALFYEGELAYEIETQCKQQGGHLRRADLEHYRVETRTPLQLNYHQHRIWSNPPPSSGGTLIEFALAILRQHQFSEQPWGNSEHLSALAHTMATTQHARLMEKVDGSDAQQLRNLLSDDCIARYQALFQKRFLARRGTTHISVIDHDLNVASMTASNGEGCGYIIPGTGVMLNNMLGEQDLNPFGFQRWPFKQRLSTMMAPSIIETPAKGVIALGSGGSNRLRTAILQTIINIADFKMGLDDAVEAPRMHFEDEVLHLENGFSEQPLTALEKDFSCQRWQERNLYFGGVHAVSHAAGEFTAKGDPRRDGHAIVVSG